MHPLRQVSALWNWLPAFRVVAETQHLPTASKLLAVSASALSRTIKLLEEEVGEELFRREGRRLILNESGETLLAATRDAMRRIHEGLLQARDERFSGKVQISATGLLTRAYILPALALLRAEYPNLIPVLVTLPAPAINGALRRGEVDVALTSRPHGDETVDTEFMFAVRNGVFCGPGHPLHGAAEVTVEALAKHPFVAPVPGDDGLTKEGWPTEVPREIGLFASRMRQGLMACADGDFLAVLPEVLAQEADLFRLPVDIIPETKVFAVRRPSIGIEDRASVVLDAIRRVAAPQSGPR